MTQRAAKPQTPRHIPIIDDDWEYLEKLYGPTSASKLGVGPAIRGIVNQYVKALRAKEQSLMDKAGATQ